MIREILDVLEANGIRTTPPPPVKKKKQRPSEDTQSRLMKDAQEKRERKRLKRLNLTRR